MVTKFKPVTAEDREWVQPLVQKGNMRGCQFSFSNIFLWGDIYRQQIARVDDLLLVKSGFQEIFYLMPCGSGDIRPAMDAICAEAAACGHPVGLWGITEEDRQVLDSLYPGRFAYEDHRHSYDYLYFVEKLATLAGKKLHGKRNHINRFLQNGDWSFEPITSENMEECRHMNREWRRKNDEKDDANMEHESVAIRRAFDNYDALHMEGGLLRLEGQVIAFTMGSELAEDTFDVNIEKAFGDIPGAYPMINREFARYLHEKYPRIVYLNREEDMGEEGLRKAKLSYYPDILLAKFMAREIR